MYTFEKTATGWVVYWGFAPEKETPPAEKMIRVDEPHARPEPSSWSFAQLIGQSPQALTLAR